VINYLKASIRNKIIKASNAAIEKIVEDAKAAIFNEKYEK
jgi:hypothetical protein